MQKGETLTDPAQRAVHMAQNDAIRMLRVGGNSHTHDSRRTAHRARQVIISAYALARSRLT